MKRLILLLALACDLEAATVNFSGMSYDTVTGILTVTASGNATAAQGTKADTALQTATSAASFPTLNQNTSGSAATLTTPRTINGVSFNGSANITVTAAGSTLSDRVTFANGASSGSAATSATTGTISVSMVTSVITCTPTGAMTYNAATGGTAGDVVSFFITTSGVSSFTLTWGTNFHKTGTLATGTTSARFFSVTFKSDGTNWWEIARTAVQT